MMRYPPKVCSCICHTYAASPAEPSLKDTVDTVGYIDIMGTPKKIRWLRHL